MPTLYINLEKPIRGCNPTVDLYGRALSDYSEALEKVADRLKIPSLMSFYGDDPDIEESSRRKKPKYTWHDASAGLATIRGLQAHLQSKPKAVSHSAAILEELKGFEAVLVKAEKKNIRWHLAVDF